MRNNLEHFWELLWAMTEKELRARYKHTVFGFFWLVANPILQMLVIGFVFSFIMKEPVKHYYFYLFTGLLVWNFFSLSLTKATPSIMFERSLIKKSVFPRAVIPLSIILSNAVHLILAQILFLIPILMLGTFSWFSLLYVIFGYIMLFTFTIGVSLLTSALNVRFRDVNFFVQAALIIWFYATPIIYTLSVIPEKYLWFFYLNPMAGIIQLFQLAFVGFPLHNGVLLTNAVLTLVIIVGGISVFRHESKYFDDWL